MSGAEGLTTSSISVHCYNNNPFNDVATRRIQGYVDGWVDIREVDDETAAAIIRNDGIDVLVDLDGHGEDGRPMLFTLRPAVTALATATRSAQMARPKLRFSTLAPVTTLPSSSSRAAPTR